MATSITASIEFAAGVYTGSWLCAAGRAHIRGQGPGQTTLRLSGSNAVFQGSASPYVFAPDVLISDMTIDGQGLAGVSVDSMMQRFRVRNVLWVSCSFGVIAQNTSGLRVTDCEFVTPGSNTGIAVYLGPGTWDTEIDGLTAWWPYDAVVHDGGADGELRSGRLRIDRSRVVQHYWAAAPVHYGTGSYGRENVTDPSNNFTFPFLTFSEDGLGKGSRVVRVLVPIKSGTLATRASASVSLSGALPNAPRCMYGDIVRSDSGSWSMVTHVTGAVASTTMWRGPGYDPTQHPDQGRPYVVYANVLGRVVAQTSTNLRVERWYRLDGSTADVPPSGSVFEVLGGNHSGGIRLERGMDDVRITDTDLEGGVGDLVTTYADGVVVDNCTFSYGRDMGLTALGDRTKVEGCRFVRNGVAGIFMMGSDPVVTDCEFIENGHEVSYFSGSKDHATLGSALSFWEVDRAVLRDLHITSINEGSSYGIRMYQSNARLRNVRTYGHSRAPIISLTGSASWYDADSDCSFQ